MVKNKNHQEKLNKKIELSRKLFDGTASSHELVYLSYLQGSINKKQYEDFLKIEQFVNEFS